MANSFVQVPPDSTGKKMQTFENTIGGNLVEAEAVAIVDTAGVSVLGTAGTASADVFSIQGVASGTAVPISGTVGVSGNVTVVQPTGTQLHAVTDTGSTTAVTGNVTVTQATAANLNAQVQGAAAADSAQVGNPVLIAGVDATGNVQELGVADANTTTPAQVLEVGGAVTTAAPTYTTGTLNPLSLDVAGNLRVLTTPASGTTSTVVGTLTNNNAAPAATNLGTLAFLANAATPTWTEGDQVLGSVDLSGHQRVVVTGPTAGGVAATGNPVQVAGVYNTALPTYTAGQTAQFQSNSRGAMEVAFQGTASAIADNNLSSIRPGDQVATQAGLAVNDFIYGGAFSGAADAARQGWSKMRTPTVFTTVQATASGATTVWTPGSGNKWRLLKIYVEVTQNASLAAGGVLTITFLDTAAAIPIAFDVFVPTTAVTTTTGAALDVELDLGAFGILSAAANNTFRVNLSAALVTGNVRVNAMGTEE
jgi:hypothetical protein